MILTYSAYYCNSEAIVQRFLKIHRKTTLPKSLFNEAAGRLERHSNTVFLKTLPEDCTGYRGVLWKKVFLEIWQYSQENTCARASFFFQKIGLFCCSCLTPKPWSQGMLISLAAEWNSDYIDKTFMQALTLRKLETFYTLFL